MPIERQLHAQSNDNQPNNSQSNSRHNTALIRARHWLPTPGNVIFTLLVVIGVLGSQNAGALASLMAPPITIPYQGRLVDQNGANLQGKVAMTFSLYNSATGGQPLWSESYQEANQVAVADGLFNVLLGSRVALAPNLFAATPELYLSITINNDTEMQPRVKLGSVPFAAQAWSVADGLITTAKLADQAVTQAKLAPDVQLGLPAGAVILWSGNLAALPTGWQLCDGSNSTPDLRNRFVVGAGAAYAPGATGGVELVTLTVAQLPAHTHTYSDKFTDGNRDNGSHAWDATFDKNPRYVTENKTTGETGGNQSFDNRPPYYALGYICKQ